MIDAPSTALTRDSFGKQSIIEITNGAHVAMTGFTIQGPGPGPYDSLDYGIFVIGGAALSIDHSTVADIADSPLSGDQNGVAIRAGSQALGQVGQLVAYDDTITGYQKGGIVIDGTGSAGIIEGNVIQGIGATTLIAQNGVQISRGATAVVNSNTISGNEYSGIYGGPDPVDDTQSTGILLYQAGDGTVAAQNTLLDNDIGIYSQSSGTSKIESNVIGSATDPNRYFGVIADQGNTLLLGNTVTGGNVGVLAIVYDGNSANSQVTSVGNTISQASQAGIEVYDQDTSGTILPTLTENYDTVSGNAVGLDGEGGQVLVQNSQFLGNTTAGVEVAQGAVVDLGNVYNASTPTTSLGVSTGGNNIAGNAAGILNTSVPILAQGNWWGDATGPSGAQPGLGDSVSGNVDGSAFLASAVSWSLPSVSGVLAAGTEGQPFSGQVAAFTDSDSSLVAGDFTAAVLWPDGTSTSGNVVGSNGSFTVLGNGETFAQQGSFPIEITVTDTVHSVSMTTTTTAVVTPAPLAGSSVTLTSVEGTPISGPVASFVDGDPILTAASFTATITWGDGHTSVGTVVANGQSGFAVLGTNTYAQFGNYSVSVVIQEIQGGNSITVTSTASIADAPITVSGLNVTAVAGQSFTGQVGIIHDANLLATSGQYSIVINWGDGSAPDTTSGSAFAIGGGSFFITGTHLYATTGTRSVTVTVHDAGGQTSAATSSVAVGGPLFSSSAWTPPRLDALQGVGEVGQLPQLFRPVTDKLVSQLGLTYTNITISGSVLLDDGGSYQLNVQETGTLWTGQSFTLTVTGSINFFLSEQGSVNSTGYTLTAVALTQTGAVNWSFLEKDGSGATVLNQGGTDNVNVTQTGLAVDGFFWKGLGWQAITQQVIQDNNLNLSFAASSNYAITETAGTESYTFSITNGQATISGTGSQPLPSLLQTGVQGYNYTLSSTFSYGKQGADTFTLYEHASSGGCFGFGMTLDSVSYSETGDATNDPSLGYQSQFTQVGTLTQTGSGLQTSNQNTSANSVSLGQTSSSNFQFSNALPYSYSENTQATDYSLTESGTYGNNRFSLNCVSYNAQGNGSYAMNLSATETSTGTFANTQTSAGLQSYGFLFNGSTQSTTGPYVQTSHLSRAETGVGTFAMANQGTYLNGGFNFTKVQLAETAAGTFSYHQDDTYTATITSGSFTQTGAGATQNVSVSGSFTGNVRSTDSLSQSGTVAYTLFQVGTMVSGSSALSCLVYSSSQTGTFSSGTTSSSSQIGTAVSNQSSTVPISFGVGTKTTTSTSNYTYNSNSTSTSSDRGSFSQGTYQAGTLRNNVFSLSCVTYAQSASDTWNVSGGDQSFSSGLSTNTQLTTTQAGVGSSIVGLSTITQTSNTSFASTYNDSFSQAGTNSTSLQNSGSYLGGVYAFGNVIYQVTSTQTGTTSAAGRDSFVSSGSSGTTTWNNSGKIGPYGPLGTSTASGLGSFTTSSQSTFNQNGGDDWTQNSSASSAVSLYERGRFSNGSYSLSSVAYSVGSSDSWSYRRTDSSAGTGTYRTSANGLGTLISGSGTSNIAIGSGSYGQTSSGTFSASSGDTLAQSGSDTLYQSERGTFAGNAFSFPSLVFQASSSQSNTLQVAGQSASSGTSALSFTSSSNQANSGNIFGAGLQRTEFVHPERTEQLLPDLQRDK